MIKGCQKKIVFIKDTGSELFDEAYLVMKPKAQGAKENDVLKEAHRILNEAQGSSSDKKSDKNGFSSFFKFTSGLLTGAIIAFCITLWLI